MNTPSGKRQRQRPKLFNGDTWKSTTPSIPKRQNFKAAADAAARCVHTLVCVYHLFMLHLNFFMWA